MFRWLKTPKPTNVFLIISVDLDWEYPKCWQVDCSAGPDSDKESFALWVKELRAAFEPKG